MRIALVVLWREGSLRTFGREAFQALSRGAQVSAFALTDNAVETQELRGFRAVDLSALAEALRTVDFDYILLAPAWSSDIVRTAGTMPEKCFLFLDPRDDAGAQGRVTGVPPGIAGLFASPAGGWSTADDARSSCGSQGAVGSSPELRHDSGEDKRHRGGPRVPVRILPSPVSADPVADDLETDLLFEPAAEHDPFAIRLLQAWSAGRCALVPATRALLGGLCLKASGGIVYSTASAQRRARDYLISHPQTARQLGRQGRQYVRSHCRPQTFAQRCLGLLESSRRVRRFAGLRVALHAPLFASHDAVSNYMADKCRLLEDWQVDFVLRLQAPTGRTDFAGRVAEEADDAVADVEIYEYPAYYPLASRIAERNGAVKVFDFHGVTPTSLWTDDSLHESERQIKLARQADWVFAHSEYLHKELVERHGVRAERIIRFPYAVDLSRFAPRAPRWSAADNYGIRGRTVLLYVGRMAPNKRISTLVRGLSRLPWNCVLVLTGDIVFEIHAQEAERARALAEELGISSRVIFTGRVSDAELQALFSCADLLVSASLHEGFGIPFIEAMASGIPCLAAEATASPEVIGQAGKTFRPDDADHFALQALALLDDSPAYEEAVEAGLIQVQSYCAEAFHDNFAAALDRVAESRRP